MKRIISIFVLFFSLVCSGQNIGNDFEERFKTFQEDITVDFKAFRDAINADYADFLRKGWIWYEGYAPIPRPKPDYVPRPPIVAPKEDVKPRPLPQPVPIKDVIPRPDVEPEPRPEPVVPIKEQPVINIPTVQFYLYGTECKVRFDAANAARLGAISVDAVADMWEKLYEEDENLTYDCLYIRDSLHLCDWAYISLCVAAAAAIYPDSPNDATMLQAYLLIQSGFDVLFGQNKSATALYSVISADSALYEYEYYLINNRRYYPLQDVDESGLFVMGEPFPESKPFRLDVTEEQLFAGRLSKERTLKSSGSSVVSATVKVNENLIDFYSSYPASVASEDFTTKWRFYANAPISRIAENGLYAKLKKVVENKSELEAVGIVLNFIQTAFEYGYDNDIWGKDRAFFADETLFYPYCDCEDRAILFSRLVRNWFGLETLLIYYPGHLATAVHFSTPVMGDYIEVDGKEYIICDPTYINAPVGVSMPDLENDKIIAIKL